MFHHSHICFSITGKNKLKGAYFFFLRIYLRGIYLICHVLVESQKAKNLVSNGHIICTFVVSDCERSWEIWPSFYVIKHPKYMLNFTWFYGKWLNEICLVYIHKLVLLLKISIYYRPLRHNLFYLNDKIKTLYSNINRRLMLAA